MKLASKIVLALGAICALAIVGSFIYLGFALMNWDTMIKGEYIAWLLNQAGYGEYADQLDTDEVREAISAILPIVGGVVMACGIPSLVNAILALVGLSNKAGKGNHVGGIIFSVLGSNPVTLVGHILGLIAGRKVAEAPKPENNDLSNI